MTCFCTDLRKSTARCGLLGAGLLMAGCLLPALPYHGRIGEPYSMLNHFISELGQIGVSPWAVFFNGCLILSGPLLGLFMLGLGRHFRTGGAYAAMTVGIISGLLCSGVGLLPMNRLIPHLQIAFAFFCSGLITILLFSRVILQDRETKLPKWLLIPGAISGVSYAAFLLAPLVTDLSPIRAVLHPDRFARPHFWLLPTLEWFVFSSVISWIILMAVCLEKNSPNRSLPDKTAGQ